MLNIAKRQILPACTAYSGDLAQIVAALAGVDTDSAVQKSMLDKANTLIGSLYKNIQNLEKAVAKAASFSEIEKKAKSYSDDVIAAMLMVRQTSDELETIVDAELWPLPTYAEMLFLR